MRERLDSGVELHTFTDAEVLDALDHIVRTKPRIVALENEFSTTSRGVALINRIKDDPSLADCEVRVLAHDSATYRTPARRGSGKVAAAVMTVDEPTPIHHRPTRRVPRTRVRDGVEVLIDGHVAALVDISALGVQVLSPKMLKPNQRVRVSLPEGNTAIRCSGSIAWASFEMPKGLPPRYRAGIELTGSDPVAIAGYASRHKRPSNPESANRETDG